MNTEFVPQHTEISTPEGFVQGHIDLPAFGKLVEDPVCLRFGVGVDADVIVVAQSEVALGCDVNRALGIDAAAKHRFDLEILQINVRAALRADARLGLAA